MSVGKRIAQLRFESKSSQRALADASGLAVSYLSRLENDKLHPTVRTLTKIAGALRVPVTAFFESELQLEASDRCPVSISGRCILDHLFVGRGKMPKVNVEGYSPQQLEALRLCNYLLHTRDKELVRVLVTMLKALLALKQ